MKTRAGQDGTAAGETPRRIPPGRGWRLAEVSLRRPGPVPVGRQLEAHLARAIGEGRLAPGSRLPSTRRVAARAPIHRNTVAAVYRRLGRRGLVTTRRGRVARVVEAVRRRPAGGRRGAAGSVSVHASDRVAVVADGRRHRRAVARELEARLGRSTDVIPVAPEAALAGPGRLVGLLPVVELAYLHRLERSHPPGWPAVVLRYASLAPIHATVRAAGSRQAVTVVTASPALRRDLRALAVGWQGGDQLLVPGDVAPRIVRSALAVSRWAWADRGRWREARPSEFVHLRRLRLVHSDTVRELQSLVVRAREGRIQTRGAFDPRGR